MGIAKSQINTDTALTEIVWLSARKPEQEFHSLMHHVNLSSLRYCFDKLDGKKAVGADQVSKAEYGENLQGNLESLILRMKQMSYRPQPVRQVLIPKGGKAKATRALGISSFEDKLIQKRFQEILESIYEPVFHDNSYGFRPNRSCHNAIKDLTTHLFNKEVETVIDIDLADFFGSIDHKILKEILAIKIKDSRFMRYISRMLKAGILTRGELTISEEGVTQGSCCSPVLANIVAHYVLDDWLEKIVKPRMQEEIKTFRYGDDMVICCRYEGDARRILDVIGKRLSKYKLKLNEEKTRMVSFSKRKSYRGIKQGSFAFLGFQFYLGRSRKGVVIPKLKTCGKRFRSKLVRIKDWAKQIKDKALIGIIWKIFCSKLRGHIQYYGVSSNFRMVAKFVHEARKIMFKWLNRRSQRKSFTWEKFLLFIGRNPLPNVKITHQLY